MGNINWIPIADMPASLKDGREVLIWAGDIGGPETATFEPEGIWVNRDGATVHIVTHFAEINAPDSAPR